MSSRADPGGLFARRTDIFPKAVDGFYRRLKWAVMVVTLAIYYVTPWLRWDRGPWAPDQAVLVDLAHRRFYFFSIEIWPHEFYYVAGLLVMAGIGLFLLTSTVGRAWCGYACPQTVWTDLFLHIERLIDGDRNAQLRLRKAPVGVEKVAKRVAKHGIWLLIGLLTGGAWIFYFADAPTLARALLAGEAAFVAYATIAVLTATTYVFGGWMREQVCIYMCPWPRIQGAMLDERSLIVTYKDWRGEPRSHGLKRAEPDKAGDCIDCNACVAVCPTGIDIRNGPQLACITCALCIDACDEVMARVGRPRGLIDYATFEGCEIEQRGGAPVPIRRTLLRSRTLLYFGLWGAVGLAMLVALGARSRLELSVAQERNPLFVQLSDGAVRNAYTLKVRNMETRPRPVRVTITGLPGAQLWDSMASEADAGATFDFTVGPDQVEKRRIYVRAPRSGAVPASFAFHLASRDDRPASDAHKARFDRPETLPMTRRFTGWHMLAAMLGFFGVILTVNMTMATLASRTFGGVVVENSYVASQQYNHWLAAARAQGKLGWSADVDIVDRRVLVTLRTSGQALGGAEVRAVAAHPLGRVPEAPLRFEETEPGRYVAQTRLPAGRWRLRLHVARDGRRGDFVRDVAG